MVTPDPTTTPDVVLITGGTGSFGSTMVRRLLVNGAGEIRVLSRDELKQHYLNERNCPVLGPREPMDVGQVVESNAAHPAHNRRDPNARRPPQPGQSR